MRKQEMQLNVAPDPAVDLVSTARTPISNSELELLLLALRPAPTEQEQVRLRELSAGDVNWGRMLSVARPQGILVHFERGLRAAVAEVPADVRRALREHAWQVHQRSVYLTAQLLRLLRCLRERGVAAIVLKGPVLAALAFEDLGRREFVDIDLLVRRRDLAAARETLLAEKFQLQFDVGPRLEQDFIDCVGQLAFVRDDGVMVELHVALLRYEFGKPLEDTVLWEDPCQVSLLGRDVATLAPDLQMLYVALHGSRHVWSSLKWVCDLGGLVRTQPASACERAWRRARTLRCERVFLLALLLATEVTGARLPEGLASRISEDRRVRRLAAGVYRRLSWCAVDPTGDWQRGWYHLCACDTVRDAVRYGICLFVAPTEADWRLLSVPRWLHALYVPLRMLRLATRAAFRTVVRFRQRWKETRQGGSRS